MSSVCTELVMALWGIRCFEAPWKELQTCKCSRFPQVGEPEADPLSAHYLPGQSWCPCGTPGGWPWGVPGPGIGRQGRAAPSWSPGRPAIPSPPRHPGTRHSRRPSGRPVAGAAPSSGRNVRRGHTQRKCGYSSEWASVFRAKRWVSLKASGSRKHLFWV